MCMVFVVLCMLWTGMSSLGDENSLTYNVKFVRLAR